VFSSVTRAVNQTIRKIVRNQLIRRQRERERETELYEFMSSVTGAGIDWWLAQLLEQQIKTIPKIGKEI
jgi:hypothetical protein